MFRHLLVAIDGSDHSDHAIEIAADLAMRYHAKLTILHVARHPHVANTLIDLQELERIEHVEFHEQDVLNLVAAKITADAEKRVRELGVPDVEVVARRGNPAQQIIEHAGDVGGGPHSDGDPGFEQPPGVHARKRFAQGDSSVGRAGARRPVTGVAVFSGGPA